MDLCVFSTCLTGDRENLIYTYVLTDEQNGNFAIRALIYGKKRRTWMSPVHPRLACCRTDAEHLLYWLALRQVAPCHLEDVLADLAG